VQPASRTPAIVFGSYCVLVWATRIRNALGQDDLSAGGKAVAVGVASAFTVGGIAVLVAALRRAQLVAAVRVLAAVTIVYWPIRVVQIVLADHGAAFVAVHVALGVISVGLSLWAWSRSVAARPGTVRTGAVL
jgi:uncharacterized membrane-anchored protein